jgi:3-oxoacyl-[acyl-carrier protein] reductase
VATIAETCGRLDVLVANAGIACDRPLARISEAAWDRTIAVNLSGVRHLLRAAQPLLLEARGMAILVGSLLGLRGAAGAAAYAASKAGLIGLGLSVAREFAPAARLNIVIPGYLPTAMGLANPEARDRARAEDLLGCDGSIDEAAAMVAFVARLGNVTGQIFHVDGRVAAR